MGRVRERERESLSLIGSRARVGPCDRTDGTVGRAQLNAATAYPVLRALPLGQGLSLCRALAAATTLATLFAKGVLEALGLCWHMHRDTKRTRGMAVAWGK